MKLIHISDLHIGKKLSEISIADDQRYILGEIIRVIGEERPDGVLIAGDVYDTSAPTVDAVRMLDEFITSLSDTGSQVFMISGNHDSPEKIGYGSALFRRSGIHIAGVFEGAVEPVRITDGAGMTADVYMVPFIRPLAVRRRFQDAEVLDYTDAMRVVLERSPKSDADFSVALVHQFVTTTYGDPETCDSEDPRIGDLDSMDASVFDGFDYVALGHLHRPQKVGREGIRYCGSPLKYSSSEAHVEKSVTVVEFDDGVRIRTVPLRPLRNVRVVKGRLDDIIEAAKGDADPNDFIYAEITDDPANAMQRIRDVYPNTVHIRMIRPEADTYRMPDIEDIKRIDPMELFEEMFAISRGSRMTDGQRATVHDIMEEVGVRL